MSMKGEMVRIISDGTGYNTRVLDSTGKIIPMVYEASWQCGVKDLATVNLKLHSRIDAWGKAKITRQSAFGAIFNPVRARITIQDLIDRKREMEKARP